MSHILNKLTLPIKGMHCRSCELLIEESLKKIHHVKKTEVNYKTGKAEIYYETDKPNLVKIEEAIAEAGYEVGEDDKKNLFSQNPKDYKDLGITVLFVLGAYWLLQGLGLTGLNIGAASNPSNFGVVVMIGLVAGFSTCMALVGGLTLGMATKHAEKHPEATTGQKFRPHLFFNFGRITGYAIFGAILGGVGSVFQLSSTVMGMLTILVGFVMLLLGLQLIEIFPALSSWKLTLPKGISKLLGISRHQKEYSHKNSMLLGAMTFFLPCGFTQAMQLYAVSTGSITGGALTMGLFALGTAPGLLSIGGLASVIKGKTAKRFFKFAGVVVIFLSLFNLSNGFTLAGFDFSSAPAQTTTAKKDPNVKLVNGVQVVKMKELAGGYSPNKFTITKGIPVRWEIDAQAPYSCASSLVSAKLKIQKNLKEGLNVIEFTPKQTGKIPFSCSMGMYTGYFNVVDKNGGSVALSDDTAPTPSAGGCGGGGTVSGKAPSAGGCGGGSATGGGGCGGGSAGGGGCGGCGGGKKFVPDESPTEPVANAVTDEQIIKTTYTSGGISPNTFKVKAGTKVRLEIDVQSDGVGCGYAIAIPGLDVSAQQLSAGVPITMEFTPTTPGDFDITCGMGMIRYGSITVE